VCKDSAGVSAANYLWTNAASKTEICDCPYCLDAPEAPLPRQMVNDTYVSAYNLVSANEGTKPLLCREGFKAGGNFTCTVKTGEVYFGAYATYPECVPLDCSSAPTAVTNQADGSSCTAAMPHNTTCAMQCVAGYKPKAKGEFMCLYGTYSGFDSEPDLVKDPTHLLPVCIKQSCGMKPSVASGTVGDCVQGDDTLGDSCTVACQAGYKRTGDATLSCEVSTNGPEDPPAWTIPATCTKHSCGTLTLSDANGEMGTMSGDKTGDTVSVGCKSGYLPSENSDKSFTCSPTGPANESPSAWTGTLTCNPVTCAAPANPTSGSYRCSGTTFGSTCALECEAGTSVVGTGDSSLTCDDTGVFSGGSKECVAASCSKPTLSANMASTTCTGSTVNSGTTCTVTCSSGYKSTGTFKCVNGAYTQNAICTPEGGPAAVAEYFVEGRLQLTITVPEGSTLDSLLSDTSFLNALKEGIAAGLDGVSMADVVVVVTRARRLQESTARRLQDAINVVYKIKVKDKAAASALTTQITTNKEKFETSFKATMKEKANVEVTGMITEAPTVTEEYVPAGQATGGTTGTSEDEDSNTGAIVGGVVGALAGVALLGFAFYFYSKKTSSQE